MQANHSEENTIMFINASPPGGGAFQAIEDTFDLTHGNRNLHGNFQRLSPEDQQEYLKMLARLLQHGIVGTETLNVNNQPYTTFATTRLGDPQLRHAPPYRPRAAPSNILDTRA